MKAKRRRSRTKTQVSTAPRSCGFTEEEEAFFRAGELNEEHAHAPAETFRDLDDGHQRRPGLLRRLFSRASGDALHERNLGQARRS